MAEKNVFIQLEPVIHKGEKRIRLRFKYDPEIYKKVRGIPECRWSKTLHSWHVPDTPKSKQILVRSGLCRSEDVWRQTTLNNRSTLSPETSGYLRKFETYLKFRRYSVNTIKVYLSMIKIFLMYYQDRDIQTLTYDDIQLFNLNYILKNNFSFNYQNQMISAIKLFFEHVEHRKIDIDEIERPKRPRKLPVVLSKKEVALLLKHVDNLKQKAVLSLIYSAGLRVGEALNMKIKDIDSTRGLIHIKGAKGKKDRVVNLSPKLLAILREYFKKYRPQEYLFNGQYAEKYTASSVRKVLHRAKVKAGIKKDITVHTLRHSFATHMLEKGIDIRYIQDLLGHNDPKTTMIYTHVSERKINTFINPLDELDLWKEK